MFAIPSSRTLLGSKSVEGNKRARIHEIKEFKDYQAVNVSLIEEEKETEEVVDEALRVDYEPQPNGTLGGRGITNNAEMEDERDAVLASQRDAEKEEERKER